MTHISALFTCGRQYAHRHGLAPTCMTATKYVQSSIWYGARVKSAKLPGLGQMEVIDSESFLVTQI